MKELSTAELQEFRDRCLQAATYGYEIGLADLYMEALASEVGQEIVPDGVAKASAAHLLGLANAALELRASGSKKAKKAAKAPEPVKEPEPKVEPAKTEEPETKVEEPKPEAPKAEEPPAKVEEPKDEKKSSSKKSGK